MLQFSCPYWHYMNCYCSSFIKRILAKEEWIVGKAHCLLRKSALPLILQMTSDVSCDVMILREFQRDPFQQCTKKIARSHLKGNDEALSAFKDDGQVPATIIVQERNKFSWRSAVSRFVRFWRLVYRTLRSVSRCFCCASHYVKYRLPSCYSSFDINHQTRFKKQTRRNRPLHRISLIFDFGDCVLADDGMKDELACEWSTFRFRACVVSRDDLLYSGDKCTSASSQTFAAWEALILARLQNSFCELFRHWAENVHKASK
jgi:hypothetical protein